MKTTLTLFALLATLSLWAQDEPKALEINWTGYVDVYYAYDFNKPPVSERQAFLYNHNRHNEFSSNLALFKVNIQHNRYRANLGFQSGTYSSDVYALEDQEFKMIHEANVGIALNEAANLWLDAGIFGSHLGFESPLAIDNPTLSRSLVAESSPYYLAGAKVTWDISEKVQVAGIWSNGWQRIRRVQGNSMASFGTQLVVKPSDNTTINWSTFVTTEDPDPTRRVMYFSNLYGMFQLSEKISAIAGLDYGQRQIAPESNATENWIAPVGILRIQHSEKYASAYRIEYFNDPNGVINGLEVLGLSANFDYYPAPNVACRFETRLFDNANPAFPDSNGNLTKSNNLTVMGSLAVKFDSKKNQN